MEIMYSRGARDNTIILWDVRTGEEICRKEGASELFLNSKEDSSKFRAVFKNRLQYTESVHREVQEWVGAIIARWKEEEPEFFVIEMIPDDFLPRDVFEAEGGATRLRATMPFGLSSTEHFNVLSSSQHLSPPMSPSLLSTRQNKKTIAAWKAVAESIYETRSSNYKSNIIHVPRIFGENEELFEPLLERCPVFTIIISHILVDKFGFRVRNVYDTSDMAVWGEEESKRVGCR